MRHLKLGLLVVCGLLGREASAAGPDAVTTATNSIDIMPITLSNLSNVVVDSQVSTKSKQEN